MKQDENELHQAGLLATITVSVTNCNEQLQAGKIAKEKGTEIALLCGDKLVDMLR